LIEAAVTCVGYDDFLLITLESAIRSVDHLTVVTAPWDDRTQVVAQRVGASVLITGAWRVNGTFNKARALNEWIDQIGQITDSTWLMTLDADVLCPKDQDLPRDALKPGYLYSARRRMCVDEQEWGNYKTSKRSLTSFPLDVQPIVGGRLWGTLPTRNEAGLCGYLQIWNPAHSRGSTRFREAPTASTYDVLFGLSFPEDARKFLPGYEVLHLGPSRVNWAGRRSPRWGQEGTSV
jgi:hypothetical protein